MLWFCKKKRNVRKRRETGGVQRMKEPYAEGLATHGDPESCAGSREAAGEALTGAHAGRVLSRVSSYIVVRSADAVEIVGRQHWLCRNREVWPDSARSETPSTHGINSHGSREVLASSVVVGITDRIVKLQGKRR